MDIWFEQKHLLDTESISEIKMLKEMDGEYFEKFLGAWNPDAFTDQEEADACGDVFILAKANIETRRFFQTRTESNIVGLLYFITNPWKITRRLKYWVYDIYQSALIYTFYIHPDYRYGHQLSEILLAKVEEQAEDIWAEAYEDETLFTEPLKRKGYHVFDSWKADTNCKVNVWHKSVPLKKPIIVKFDNTLVKMTKAEVSSCLTGGIDEPMRHFHTIEIDRGEVRVHYKRIDHAEDAARYFEKYKHLAVQIERHDL